MPGVVQYLVKFEFDLITCLRLTARFASGYMSCNLVTQFNEH